MLEGRLALERYRTFPTFLHSYPLILKEGEMWQLLTFSGWAMCKVIRIIDKGSGHHLLFRFFYPVDVTPRPDTHSMTKAEERYQRQLIGYGVRKAIKHYFDL